MTDQLTAQRITNMLRDRKGTRIISFEYAAEQKLAATNKGRNILKVSTFRMMLGMTKGIYETAMKNNAAKIAENDRQDIADFEPRESLYISIDGINKAVVALKSDPTRHYMKGMAISSGNKSTFFDQDTGLEISREDVAVLCTPSTAKKMLDTNPIKTHVSGGFMYTLQWLCLRVEGIRNIKVGDELSATDAVARLEG